MWSPAGREYQENGSCGALAHESDRNLTRVTGPAIATNERQFAPSAVRSTARYCFITAGETSRMMTTAAEHIRAHHHAVQFYEQEEFLVDRVAEFLAAAIHEGEPCVVIATGEQNAMFADRLRTIGADPSHVMFLDARTTLEKFLHRGMPDAGKFNDVIGGVIRDVSGAAGRVRAYGEMV